MLFGMGFMKLMVSTRFGLSLLENHPRLFSMGQVSKEGPTLETAQRTNFKITLVGKGWKTKADKHDSEPDREVTLTFGIVTLYRVTIHDVPNLPLTSKQKLRFSTWASD